jgi:cell wall-associated NlpC family hydrolase
MDPATAVRLAQLAARWAHTIRWRRLLTLGCAGVTLVGLLGMSMITNLLGGEQAATADVTACGGTTITPTGKLTPEQKAVAAIIVTTGRRLKVPQYGWVVATAVALTESGLDPTLTPTQSDRDSAGAFQQRPEWGPLAARLDPTQAATMFYTGGRAGQPGLLDIPRWQHLTLTVAAQAVQRSGFPHAYTPWASLALATVTELTITSVNPKAPAATPKGQPVRPALTGAGLAARRCASNTNGEWQPLAGTTTGEAAANAAAHWLGVPYAWGGGTRNGPSEGIAQGTGTIGFDCSGLVLHAWWRAAHINFPHSAAAIAAMTTPVNPQDMHAGDILNFATHGTGITHDGIADGHGGMIHAPHTGATITIVPNILTDPYYKTRLVSITRPQTGTP